MSEAQQISDTESVKIYGEPEEERISLNLAAAEDAAHEFYNRPQIVPANALTFPVEVEAEEMLFDRAEQQFVTLVDGDGLETVYRFGGYDDDQWVELDKMQPFAFELEDGDGMAPAPTDYTGTDWYFDNYCQNAEGFDELPDNWKAQILSDEKAEVVNNLFAVQVIPPAKNITPGIKRRLSGGDVTYTLRVPLHRRGMRGYCDLDHTLRPRNDAALRKFVAISGRAVLKADKQFIRQDARALGKLYDPEIVTTDAGYKSPVPLFHKVAVIRAHYAAKVQAARKK